MRHKDDFGGIDYENGVPVAGFDPDCDCAVCAKYFRQMPVWTATFADLRRANVTLAEWLVFHRGTVCEPIAPLSYEQWVLRLKRIA